MSAAAIPNPRRAFSSVPVRRAPQAAPEAVPWLTQLLFIVSHFFLMYAVGYRSPRLRLFALALFVAGLGLALATRRFDRVACVAAYIMGIEVFLRMRGAQVPWEFAKLATIGILAVGIVRMGHVFREGAAYAYFLALVPSIWLTLEHSDAVSAREAISFNLAGPLALAVGVIYFSGLRLTAPQLRWILVSAIAPIVALAAVVVRNIQRLREEIEFTGSSNWATSGGFGPNQVASAFALGALFCVLYLLLGPAPLVMRLFLLGLSAGLLGLSALTFTRGGVYTTVAAAMVGAAFLMKEKKLRRRVLLGGAAFLVIFGVFILPRLVSFTGGAITTRFEKTDSTGRDLLVLGDLNTWAENPILGSGPGLSVANRARLFKPVPPHTEYSRMLGEHGIPGLVSLIFLAGLSIRSIRRAPTPLAKALAATWVVWSLLYMAIDATRTLAPSFLFGLSYATIAIGPVRRKASVQRPSRSEAPAFAFGR